MKGDTEVILMVVFFFSGFFLGAALIGYEKEVSPLPYIEAVMGAVATLAAAFFGAKYAFKLQLNSQEQQAVKEKVKAGNKAIFELIRTYNQFANVRDQFIDEHRKSEARHIYIMPMAGGLHLIDLNFDELAFLFDSEDPDVLKRLAMFQQEVLSTVDVINRRSRLHIDVLQPSIEKLEQQLKGPVRLDQLENALGIRYTETLKKLTDAIIDSVDGVIVSSERLINEVRTLLRTKFAGHSIIAMAKPNQKAPIPENNPPLDTPYGRPDARPA